MEVLKLDLAAVLNHPEYRLQVFFDLLFGTFPALLVFAEGDDVQCKLRVAPNDEVLHVRFSTLIQEHREQLAGVGYRVDEDVIGEFDKLVERGLVELLEDLTLVEDILDLKNLILGEINNFLILIESKLFDEEIDQEFGFFLGLWLFVFFAFFKHDNEHFRTDAVVLPDQGQVAAEVA